jgi:iron complex outermembrane receptor protein
MKSTRVPSRQACVSSLALAIAVASAASAAEAQTEARASTDTVTEVIVTGTRIRGVAAVGSTAVSLNRDQIVSSGATTASDLLRKVPQVIGLGPSAVGTSAQNGAANGTRGSGVNLRGVGVNATLLLFDGNRFPAAGTQGQYTDPSVLPFIALERIEVVPDGASAIYGSDAVAGVVNLIPRSNFDGAETSVRASFADGYSTNQISQIFGHRSDKGSAILAFEHTYNSALEGQSRDFYTSDQRPRGGHDYRSTQCSPGNIVIAGVSYAIPVGGVTAANASSLAPGTSNACDNLKLNYIIPKQTKNNVLFSVREEMSPSVDLFAQGYYSRREVTNRNVITASLSVPNTNAFYVRPPGAPAGTSETVNYAFTDVFGYNYVPSVSQSYAMNLGFDVRLPKSWKGKVTATYGRSDDVNKQRTNYYAAGGAAALASSNPATALNVFGGATSPDVIALLKTGSFVIQARTGLESLTAQADGPLFDLPGGTVRLAVGAEARNELLVTNLFSGTTLAPVAAYSHADRDVKAVYGELFVPLVGEGNALPLVQRVNLSLAGRYERYSDFGSTSNPKVGLTWNVVEGLSVKGSYGKSFRAASLAENRPVGGGAGLYGDTLPCATGTCYGIGIAGGNVNLKPEKATTWSTGVEWKPAALPGLHASLSYFSIDYRNQIVALRGTSGLLTLPYYAPYVTFNPTPAQIAALQAQYISNNAINVGAVTYIQDGRRQNLGASKIEGLDFALDYGWDTGLGAFELSATGGYFTKFTFSPVPGVAPIDVVDKINYPQSLRTRLGLDWRQGGWSAQGTVNYVSGYDNNTVAPVQKVDSYTTVDLRVAYRVETASGLLNGVTVAIEAQNLFDQDPPFVDVTAGYDSQSANPIGRLVGLSVTKSW